MAPQPFASDADFTPEDEVFVELAEGVYALTAEGHPNVGAVEGEDFLVCVDARATPKAARRWLDVLRRHTGKPVRHLVLSHYHAVRALGASAFGADEVIAHENTRALIAERGRADRAHEHGRVAALFEEPSGIPGLTWPTMTFSDRLTIPLGGDRGVVELRYAGRGHTAGDVLAWLPHQRVLFAGDLVGGGAAPCTGDGFHDEWATSTLDRVAALGAEQLVGGRGAPARDRAGVEAAIARSRHFLDELRRAVGSVHVAGGTVKEAFRAAHAALAPRHGRSPAFERCLPFDVQRYWDECDGVDWPRIWTPERERAVREALR
ncbi:MBL fold metallo-hydrolase [Saccharothrix longispora]|uniref:MBL fold metallo-hydrolase n=1 Tax=Saccharothrix longispora TaxID=33920 RepID=UPI0028FD5769|nr:MBL fold metallo-hydrolase [Saccharothrix longispora]MDU0291683.1 MBL fold metallo-hydrolase [Saccharothrix longispora]